MWFGLGRRVDDCAHTDLSFFFSNIRITQLQGFVDVDMYTTQHVAYPNIFALGDASSLPTSKTMAAITGQARV